MVNSLIFTKVQTALRENLLPAVFLQIFAVSLGLSYYYWPASLVIFDFVAGLKLKYGIGYAFFATAVFGGLIPYLYLYFSGKLGENKGRELVFYLLFWALKGVEADLFYRLQAFVFGNGTDVLTIIKKTAVDQFIFAAFWVSPTIAIVYMWKERGFSIGKLAEGLTRNFFLNQVPLIAVTNWLVWLPAVSVIYTMPLELQIPMFNLVVCFYSLLLSVLGKD